MTRVYTIWPADRQGMPASCSSAWRQEKSWVVLDISDGIDAAHVVEGPVSRQEACKRELELRAIARRTARAAKSSARHSGSRPRVQEPEVCYASARRERGA
ncbi:MAG TPA: hypothetical protein VLE97_06540 [Gaiellaceae bacterium]|nr:hypothetical protein [Gaiellaceae bacterium]